MTGVLCTVYGAQVYLRIYAGSFYQQNGQNVIDIIFL